MFQELDEVAEGHFEVGFSLFFFSWGKKLITVSFRMFMMLGVCHMADQIIFMFQFSVMTDRASVLMFWGFERYTDEWSHSSGGSVRRNGPHSPWNVVASSSRWLKSLMLWRPL